MSRQLLSLTRSPIRAEQLPAIHSSLLGEGILPGGLLIAADYGYAADVTGRAYPTNPAPNLHNYRILQWGWARLPFSPGGPFYGYTANIRAAMSTAWNLKDVEIPGGPFLGNVVTRAFAISSHTGSEADEVPGSDVKMKLIAPCKGLITRHTGATKTSSGDPNYPWYIITAPDSSEVVNLSSGEQEIYHGPGGYTAANAAVSVFWPGLQSADDLPAFPLTLKYFGDMSFGLG